MDASTKLREIEKLNKRIAVCRRCHLSESRTHTVPGQGNTDARIMFIGEAPGKNEDIQGRPFVGRAGNILSELLESVKLTREQIYICNILKCRPPKNRNPLPEEIKACAGNLDSQIRIIDPAIIGTLGNFATAYIFSKFNIPYSKISLVKGKVFEVLTPFGDKKIVPLYHPAVATYSPSKLKELKKDFQVIKKLFYKKESL